MAAKWTGRERGQKRASSKKKKYVGKPYQVGGVGGSRGTSEFAGAREGLFQVSANVNTDTLNEYGIALEMAIGKAIYKLAQRARDIAREWAPSKTGMLRAGIYATAPATKEEVESFASGKVIGAHKMRGHSSGYWKAINTASKRSGGIDKDDGQAIEGLAVPASSDILIGRTQRLKSGTNLGDVAESLDIEASDDLDDKEIYRALATAMPFNSMGRTNRNSFFVGIGSAVYYSAWVEFGTSKMKARPFFTVAAKWMVAQTPRAIQKEVALIRK